MDWNKYIYNLQLFLFKSKCNIYLYAISSFKTSFIIWFMQLELTESWIIKNILFMHLSHTSRFENLVWRQKHHSSWLIFFFRIFSWLFISIIQEPYPNKQCNLLWNLIHHFHQNSQARGAIKVTTPDTPAHIQ